MPPIECPTSTTGPRGAITASTVSRSLPSCVDGVGVRRRLGRLAVPALVVEHHPDLRAPLLGQPRPLKVEGAHAKTEAVREHHRQRGVLRTDLTHREVHSVGSGHHVAAVGVEQLEILALVGIVGARHAGAATCATDTPATVPTAVSPAAPASHGAFDLAPRGRSVSLSLNGFGPSLLHGTFG